MSLKASFERLNSVLRELDSVGTASTDSIGTSSAHKLLIDIAKLGNDTDTEKNLQQIKQKINKLSSSFNDLSGEQREKISIWLTDCRRELDQADKKLVNSFWKKLSDEFKFELRGLDPEFQTDFFTLQRDSNRVVIWYGPKQEKLATCKLSYRNVGEKLRALENSLGFQSFGLKPDGFVNILKKAYDRAMSNEQDKQKPDVPIIHVLSEVAFLLQKPSFHQDPRKENYHGYGRADFSYDIYRCKQEALLQNVLIMTVATRNFAKSKSDYIWIPKNKQGDGTIFSHVRWKREVEKNDRES